MKGNTGIKGEAGDRGPKGPLGEVVRIMTVMYQDVMTGFTHILVATGLGSAVG